MKGPMVVSALWLLAACCVTVALMIRAAGGVFQLSGFYLWALVPYLALGWHSFRESNAGPAERRARNWASCAVFLAAGALYGDAVLLETGSTSGLIFVFGPLYLLIGGFAITAVLTAVFKKRLPVQHG